MVTVNPDLGSSIVIPKQGPSKEMLSITPLADGRRKVRINSSSLSIIQECPRKAQYALLEGWKATDESPATIFGSAIHKALEVFYSSPLKDRYVPSLDVMESMSYGHKKEGEDHDIMLRAVRSFIDRAAVLQPLPETDKRSIQNGVWILYHYFKVFEKDPHIAYVDEHGPFLERGFSFVLYEDKDLVIETFGTIDAVLQNTLDGTLLPSDHKTTSALFGFGDSSSYYDREKPCHQYTCYLMGAREVFGIKSDSFMVSIIEVKPKPKTARGSPPNFPRQITTRNENDFQEFRDAVVDSVERYLHYIQKRNFPIGHVNACGQYGGCQYRQVCSAHPSLRESILSAKFSRST